MSLYFSQIVLKKQSFLIRKFNWIVDWWLNKNTSLFIMYCLINNKNLNIPSPQSMLTIYIYFINQGLVKLFISLIRQIKQK